MLVKELCPITKYLVGKSSVYKLKATIDQPLASVNIAECSTKKLALVIVSAFALGLYIVVA